MELELTCDGEGQEFSKVTKRLRNTNGIPIRTANDNPILDAPVYEVDYLDDHKTAVVDNTTAENIFHILMKKGLDWYI